MTFAVPRTFKSLQAHRNYRLFFAGQITSLCGTWMQNVALYWLILGLTHSAVAVGLLSLARFGPFTLFGLFAGVVADRFDNRKTVIITQSVQMVLSAVLALLGLLTSLFGGARDARAAADLSEQGVGPDGLRAELRVRLALASVLGVIAGLGLAVLLTRLAVASVRAAGTVADPSPPVLTVMPWPELAAWGAGLLAVLALAGALATRAQIRSSVGGILR